MLYFRTLILAYSITSAYSVDGVCITTHGAVNMLVEPATVTEPAPVASIRLSSAVEPSPFIDALYKNAGISRCQNGNPPLLGFWTLTSSSITSQPSNQSSGSNVTSSAFREPTANGSISSPISLASAAKPSTSEENRQVLNATARIEVGVIVPVVAIISSLVGILFWRRHRKQNVHGENESKPTDDPAKDTQPYLRRKAELEDDENRKRELEAQEQRPELNAEDTIYEISGPEDRQELFTDLRTGLPSHRLKHELAGGEFAQELENG